MEEPKDPDLCEVGDYVTVEQLIACGGKFYELGDKSLCDTALATFELRPPLGFCRIE